MKSIKTIKNARKMLEVPMEADLQCKMVTRKRAWTSRETAASEKTNPHKKTKYAYIVEAHASTRKRLKSTLPRNPEDHIAEKWFNSLTHYNLVHKLIPMPQAMKIPDAKAAVNNEWEKLEKIPTWTLDKMKRKKDVLLKAQRDKIASLMDI